MNIFDTIVTRKPKSNLFDLSHEKKLSCNMGELIPILYEDVLPGDKFKVNSEIFIRLAPMLAPIMHRVNVYTHYFFVPNRIIWDEWKDFITGGEDGKQAPLSPKITMGNSNKAKFKQGELADYLGIPPIPDAVVVNAGLGISALPFRAYQTIYNEYYRDQNLTPQVPFTKDSGDQAASLDELVTMRKRAWEKDYFTSALPWPQRGEDVNLPVNSEFSPQYRTPATVTTTPATSGAVTNTAGVQSAGGVDFTLQNLQDPQQVTSTSVTINELRTATRLQEWLEKNARGGSRYIEQILSHFGVRSSDARLQRPEYLGGGKNPIVISEVLNQAGTTDTQQSSLQPVGEMAGHGISVGKTNHFNKSFEEHGIIMGLLSVLPKTTYMQGIPKQYLKTNKLDYYWPEFAHLGEQPIQDKELYVEWTNVQAGVNTFGYTPKYAEYKYRPSTTHGEFRTTLKYWHMAREFSATPVLNTDFVTSSPTHDIFAVEDATIDKLYIQIYNKVKAIRPMPYFATPYL